MIEPVTCTLDDNIAVLSVQADVFDMRLCQAFADTLADVLANDQVQGIVFGCTDAGTWPQVSIADVDRSDPVPLVADICATIQAAPIPVVAVLQGPAVGPAAELILAAHYRVFTRNAKLQFPGMNLGMIPGAGGTQRLARWLGAKNAMDLLFAGGALDAEAAKAVDLVDASSRSAPTTNTVKFTKNLVKQNAGPRPDSADRAPGLADPKAFQQAVDTARSGITRGDLMAKGKVIDCVEVALLLPLYAGLAFEAEAYQDCKSAVQSHGLRRSFLSTGVFEVVGQNVDNIVGAVCVNGAGPQGRALAQLSLAAGYQVILVGADQAQTGAVRDQINNIWDRQLAQGILTADVHAARGDALKVSTTLSEAKACDIFIDTTHRGHAAIAEVAKPGAVLALTSLPTGTLDVQSRRDDTVVLRFAAPLSRNPLVEVAVEHIETSPALPMAISFVQGLGKTPIPTGITSIALGASLRAAMRYAAMELLCLGASPAQVDGAMRAFGFDQGVFQTIDQTGMEAAANLHLVAGLGQHPQSVQIPLLQTLLDAGMAGQRSGAGFYVYPDEGALQPNDAVGPHVAALRAELGYAPRQVKAGEIARRIWIALCNCGAELIAQGVAPDADTIDAIMVLGHGYPIRRGGPMASAEWAGLIQVVRDLKLLSGDNPFWTPSSAMLAANLDGQRFGRKSLQQNA